MPGGGICLSIDSPAFESITHQTNAGAELKKFVCGEDGTHERRKAFRRCCLCGGDHAAVRFAASTTAAHAAEYCEANIFGAINAVRQQPKRLWRFAQACDFRNGGALFGAGDGDAYDARWPSSTPGGEGKIGIGDCYSTSAKWRLKVQRTGWHEYCPPAFSGAPTRLTMVGISFAARAACASCRARYEDKAGKPGCGTCVSGIVGKSVFARSGAVDSLSETARRSA